MLRCLPLLLLALAGTAVAAPAPLLATLDEKAAAAWTAAGARRGWMSVEGRWEDDKEEAGEGAMPAFRLERMPEKELPVLGAPFGLGLDEAKRWPIAPATCANPWICLTDWSMASCRLFSAAMIRSACSLARLACSSAAACDDPAGGIPLGQDGGE